MNFKDGDKDRTCKVAVASTLFSATPALRAALLKQYPNTCFNTGEEYLPYDGLCKLLSGCKKAIIGLQKIDEKLLSQLPDLRVISRFGVGIDNLDLASLKKYNVQLGLTKGVNRRSVAELVVSSAIALLHRAVSANQEVRNGNWIQYEGTQLSHKTVGIIGCGHIGKDVVRLLQPFECTVLAHDIRCYDEFYSEYKVVATDLDELLCRADVITLHVPLDSSTLNILSKDKLALMQNHAILLNYARGGLVDERELIARIENGTLGGAALDVLEVEPPTNLRIAHLANVLVTPHIGGNTVEAIMAMGSAAIAGLEDVIDPLDLLDEDIHCRWQNTNIDYEPL